MATLAWPAVAQPSEPMHFVFFGYDRERIREESFLETPALVGAQLKYSWRQLEPAPGDYALELIAEDLRFLEAHTKRLFIQVQDVSFFEKTIPVPAYLTEDPRYSGGVAEKFLRDGGDTKSDGWVARRWDPAVRERFTRLLAAIAREFDGKLEGVNLPETAIDFGENGEFNPDGFSPELYLGAVKDQMTALGGLFEVSKTMQYANFMPGEWLPWTDKGYLRAVHAHAAEVGVGVGGPDLLPFRRGQLSHSYPLIAARTPGVVAGAAVQDGNLSETDPATGKSITVETLDRFARSELRLDYIFWGTEEPHYSERVLPFLDGLAALPVDEPSGGQ